MYICRVEFVALTNKYGAVNLGQVSQVVPKLGANFPNGRPLALAEIFPIQYVV